QVPAVALEVDLFEVQPAVTHERWLDGFEQRLPLSNRKLWLRNRWIIRKPNIVFQSQGIKAQLTIPSHTLTQRVLAFQSEKSLRIGKCIGIRESEWFRSCR